MKQYSLKYGEINYLPPLVQEYLDGKSKTIQDLYPHDLSIESILQVAEKTSAPDKGLLKNKIKEQYKRSGIDLSNFAEVFENIEALARENTFTITTGHQLCTFTGPLFFPYKILSAIKLAEKLNDQQSDQRFVPLFWMASEDHDQEEASTARVFQQVIKWETDEKGAVGRMDSSTLKPALEQLKSLLSDNERDQELLQLFESAYLEHDNMADATRYLVHYLFQEFGLIILDADDAQLKELFKDTMENELLNSPSKERVETMDQILQKAGHSPQVTPRPINLFYLEKGMRERIVKNGADYEVLNTDLKFTREEIQEEIRKHPEKFSPNVILRPLYQETILPNVAYVGGGGELSYWFQLKGVFDYFETSLPVLVLRNSALIIDKTMNKKMAKCEMELPELFEELDQVIREHVKEQSNQELELEEEKKELTDVFNRVLKKAQEIDPALEKSVKGQSQKAQNLLAYLEKKLIKAEKGRQETKVKQIKSIMEKAFPGNIPQERMENFIPFYLKYGKEFFSELKNSFTPLDDQLTILRDEEG